MDEAAFLRTIGKWPADAAPRLVFADWLTEQGRDHEAAAWCQSRRFVNRLRGLRWLSVGFGLGAGFGLDAGSGDGSVASFGFGLGSGTGSGASFGFGLGCGTGSGLRLLLLGKATIVELGKPYLLLLHDGLAYVGIPDRVVGHDEWAWRSVSMITRTGNGNN